MAADVATSLKDWSTTASSNAPSGSTAISTNLDDNLRQIQTVVRYLAASDSIASATTTDLGSKDAAFLTVSGTTTITGLGTVSAGIYKWVVFSGALTLTHNGTSLILPTTANITTAAGDTALFLSLGSGNWRCLSYTRATGLAIAGDTLTSPTITSPTINDGYTEEIYAVVDAAGVALSPTNGSIQTWTLGASRTPTAGTWANGQSMTLMIDDGSAYTVAWTTIGVTWKTNGGSVPTLNTSGYTVIQLWKVGNTVYGARVGDA